MASLRDTLSENTISIYRLIEEELIVNLAKRLRVKASEENDVSLYITSKLDSMGALTEDNIRKVQTLSKRTPQEINKLLLETGLESVELTEKQMQQALEKGADIIKPQEPPKTSPVILNILEQYEAQALNVLNLTNATLIDQAEVKFLNIINKAEADILLGNKTLRSSVRQSVRELANKGVPAFVDRAGRQWSPEAYVSNVLRTTSNNVTNEMQEARMDEWSSDLVEISSHMGARPKCAPYQGKIFSRSGRHPKYPSLMGTSIGEPDGLFGINCRHVQYPYFEGISVQRFTAYDRADNAKSYEESQQQRAMERSIRKAKTQLRAFEALNDEQGAREAKALIRQRQAAMRDFIDDTGRTRRYAREQVH